MFKVWFVNFRYWAEARWETLEAAITAAREYGFEASVHAAEDDRPLAFVSPIGGARPA